MKALKKRLKEPSTWAGLGIVLGAIAPISGPAAPILGALAAAAGGVAIMMGEKGQAKP